MINPEIVEQSLPPVPMWCMAEVEDYRALPNVLQQLTNQGIRVQFPPMLIPSPLAPNVFKIVILGVKMVIPEPPPVVENTSEPQENA